MATRSFLLRFTVSLSLVLGVSLALHCQGRMASGLRAFGDLLPASYGINFLLAAIIVWCLYLFRRKIRLQIGFLFIGGSFLKFGAFFLLLYPDFMEDGALSRAEFASFFVPYFLALILETYFTAKMLRELENEDQR